MKDNNTPHIIINNKSLDLSNIGSFAISNPFEASTVSFIEEWLSGQPIFELQTSGSTGTPKKIKIKRSQMEASARQTMKALDISKGNALVCLDTTYIAGKMMLVRALIHQMDIIAVTPGANPLQGLTTPPDFAALVPLQVEAILTDEHSKKMLNSMKAIIIGGAPVSNHLAKQIESLQVAAYATYGMTETVSHIALKRLNGFEKNDTYVAFDEVKLSLDDRGCLTIQSAVTDGEKIITNDIVDLKTEHTFEWLGRIDNVINSGGVKIQSEKVERVIEKIFSELDISKRFFIAGIDDSKLGKKVVMVVESEHPLPETEINEQLKKMVSKYEIPKQIFYIASFAETKTGKVNRGVILKEINF
ncbi:AMP-binding protein [Fulvivirga sediminis]|uniref:AMP-binding protein n=1 Tax=Fulvivirga sediminis TaxID=2803949 RepID=A0A937F622_9BACT|nr:AMP-binding protein [Fulvivirga sediminis]MBL3655319.1 AMP-binding protein [Fulvivirga sediminis]